MSKNRPTPNNPSTNKTPAQAKSITNDDTSAGDNKESSSRSSSETTARRTTPIDLSTVAGDSLKKPELLKRTEVVAEPIDKAPEEKPEVLLKEVEKETENKPNVQYGVPRPHENDPSVTVVELGDRHRVRFFGSFAGEVEVGPNTTLADVFPLAEKQNGLDHTNFRFKSGKFVGPNTEVYGDMNIHSSSK